MPATIKKWFNLWNMIDLLAFTVGTVSDSTTVVSHWIPVEDPMLERKFVTSLNLLDNG